MRTLLLAQASGTGAGDIALGITGVAIIVAVIVIYRRNAGLGEGTGKLGRALVPTSNVVTRSIEVGEIEGLMASIGSHLASRGYLPQVGTPGLYVYGKRKGPSVIITVLLLLLWIIPGIIYLIIGWKHEVVTIKVTELPLGLNVDGRGEVDTPVCINFDINAPASIRRWILGFLAPYAVNQESVMAHPEQLLIGRSFEKVVSVDCDHCGYNQEVAVPFMIEKITCGKGRGPGGSKTVICANPACRSPFDFDWDGITIEFDFTHGEAC